MIRLNDAHLIYTWNGLTSWKIGAELYTHTLQKYTYHRRLNVQHDKSTNRQCARFLHRVKIQCTFLFDDCVIYNEKLILCCLCESSSSSTEINSKEIENYPTHIFYIILHGKWRSWRIPRNQNNNNNNKNNILIYLLNCCYANVMSLYLPFWPIIWSMVAKVSNIFFFK